MERDFTEATVGAVARLEVDIHAAEASLWAEEIRRARALHPSSFGRTGGEPDGFLTNGEVMIRRLCLVAWPSGSEWRTRRQQHSSITTRRRNP